MPCGVMYLLSGRPRLNRVQGVTMAQAMPDDLRMPHFGCRALETVDDLCVSLAVTR